jgi:hypothetical protein
MSWLILDLVAKHTIEQLQITLLWSTWFPIFPSVARIMVQLLQVNMHIYVCTGPGQLPSGWHTSLCLKHVSRNKLIISSVFFLWNEKSQSCRTKISASFRSFDKIWFSFKNENPFTLRFISEWNRIEQESVFH